MDGRAVKSNKTPFLYLLFRQCPRDDNETCTVNIVCVGPDIAGHSQKNGHAHVYTSFVTTRVVLYHTRNVTSIHS